MSESDNKKFGTPTSQNGAPSQSDRQSLTVGNDGPIVLHDVHLIEQLAQFNRENIPERKPHAKGSGAFGVFEVTHDVSKYTKAAMFQPGVKTEMLARFSTVAGELGSADTVRDPRGFALKFYTTEGNYDLVGNNTPIFFMRDPMKFPHFIRTQKRLPDSELQSWHMRWDWWTLNPESSHQVAWLLGDRGLPKTWRHMDGFGSHTFMWINDKGEQFWVKYHFKTAQGIEFLTEEEGQEIAGKDPDFHRRDLFNSIENGDFPSWDLSVQIMPVDEAKDYRFNPFDLTKVWSQKDYPRIPVGRMTLNRNPTNHFAQIEQAAFSPGNVVPGIGFSPDKMLLARTFAYNDAHRYRVGANFNQLPVNQPKCPVNTYAFDGQMNYNHSGNAAKYAANSEGRPYADNPGRDEASFPASGDLVRDAYTHHPEDDDVKQAHDLVRNVIDDAARERLVSNVVGTLDEVESPVLERVFEYWKNIDQEVGQRIEDEYKKGK